jgi:hypothetical protein
VLTGGVNGVLLAFVQLKQRQAADIRR